MRAKCVRLGLVLALGLGLACAAGCLAKDREPPELRVDSPSRASLSQESSILVEGLASDLDSGMAELWVGEIRAELSEDGRFRVELPAQSGAQVIRTRAIDQAGNESTDTRTVLVGGFESAELPIADGLMVSIDQPSFSAISIAAESLISEVGLAALIAPEGSFQVGSGSCLQATIEITDAQTRDIDIELAPTDGGIHLNLVIHDLSLDADTNYDLVCIPGSAPIVVEADRVEIDTTLALAIEDGELSATLVGTETSFENLRFSVGVLPSEIAELLIDELDLRLGNLLSSALSGAIEPVITEALLGLGEARSLSILGTEIHVEPKATSLDFNAARGIVGIAPRFSSDSSKGAVYLANPTATPTLNESGVELAVVDDSLNQALAVLWVSGALEQRIDLVTEEQDLGFGIVDGIEIAAPIPPIAELDEAKGALKITVGDLQVSFLRDGQATRVAANLSLTLATVAESGELALQVFDGHLDVDRIDSTGFLSDGDLRVLSGVATELIRNGVSQLIGTLPLPDFYGLDVAPPQTSAGPGFLLVNTTLSSQ